MAGPTVTVLDLCTEALSLLGVYAPGEPIAAADSGSLLFTLNGIVDGYCAEPLTIYSLVSQTYNTTPGKASYTFGVDPSNDWVSAWLPPRISYYGAMIAGNLETGMTPLSDEEWASIGLKGLGSTIGLHVWTQYGAAYHTIDVWPVPSGVEPIVLYCPQQVPKFASISDEVLLPPGYQELLTYELTLKSAAKFGAQVPDWVPLAWADAKAKIKEANFQALDVSCDPALTGRGRRTGGGSIDFYLGR